MPPTDLNLFHLIADKNEKAFTAIYNEHHSILFSRIRRFIRNETAALDITQDVFIKLWLHGKPLKDVRNPAGWLNRVAANVSINYLRRQQCHKNVLQIVGYTNPEYIAADMDLSYKQLQLLIQKGMEELSEMNRAILQLHLEKGYGPKLIARSMNMSERSVKRRLESSRQFLRFYIKDLIGSFLLFLLFFWL